MSVKPTLNSPSHRRVVHNVSQTEIDHKLAELDNDPAVNSFLEDYPNMHTKLAYVRALAEYFRWLDSQGLVMTPSELLRDNLNCVFNSEATDTATKAKHTRLLKTYINTYLFQKGCADAKRRLVAAAIRTFYQSQNSPLFGAYKFAETPANDLPSNVPALYGGDIRKVMAAMNIEDRAPLLVSWQSGLEIGRVYRLEGRIPQTGKLEFPGRKGHRESYYTFVGFESLETIRSLAGRRYHTYATICMNFRDTAAKLGAQGLLQNPNLRSWHPHALRHSFKTEAEHLGIRSEIIEFFMGHTEGIKWVYSHSSEVHPEDIINAYRKIEPALSLLPDRVRAEEEFTARERTLREEMDRLHAMYLELRKEFQSSQTPRPSLPEVD